MTEAIGVIVYAVIVGMTVGLAGIGLLDLWVNRIGCSLRGHSFEPRYYTPTFCTRAAKRVGQDGHHLKEEACAQ